jgi:hypothetical protein
MKAIKSLVIVTSAILIMANCAFATGWRGIVPLHSTKKDVERILGPSLSTSNLYKLNDMVVVIQYSDGPCEKCWPFGWNVPADTVVTITIRPTGKLDLADSGLNLSAYERMKDPEVEGIDYYTDQNEGITITYRVFDHFIDTIAYGPMAKDSDLACPASRRNSRGQTDAALYPQKFDDYGDMAFSEEVKLLDYFASRLREPETDLIGYIVVYAGQRARFCEADLRATQARRYLVNQRGIKSEKIVVINGGYREKLTVELYVGTATSSPLIIMPTIRPSKVHIIRDNKTTATLRKSLKLTRSQCERCK